MIQTASTDNIKFINGEKAREIWAKDLTYMNNHISIQEFNYTLGNSFTKKADILLDDRDERITTLMVIPLKQDEWKLKQENIYIITRNDIVMKIGGTRDGMNGRWHSYLGGHSVSQRKDRKGNSYAGKMSVTNAYLYHTIENDIIKNNSKWEFYTFVLPKQVIVINIFGEETEIITQTYHAYESICIKKYKQITGYNPILCDNSDPSYK